MVKLAVSQVLASKEVFPAVEVKVFVPSVTVEPTGILLMVSEVIVSDPSVSVTAALIGMLIAESSLPDALLVVKVGVSTTGKTSTSKLLVKV